VNVRYLSVAEEELGQAIEYYEDKEVGLGLRFYAEYRAALERILAYPDAWYALSENTRRCRTKVFPFGIIYQIRSLSKIGLWPGFCHAPLVVDSPQTVSNRITQLKF
jgi:hypothetical protein